MASKPANRGEKQDGRFKKGQSGNPSGRPAGSQNRATVAVRRLLDGEAEELTRHAIEQAKAGDNQALRLCLERICPPRKDDAVSFTLPAIESAQDTVTASAAVLQAVADGKITPTEAQQISGLIENHRRALETVDIERRLARIEASS